MWSPLQAAVAAASRPSEAVWGTQWARSTVFADFTNCPANLEKTQNRLLRGIQLLLLPDAHSASSFQFPCCTSSIQTQQKKQKKTPIISSIFTTCCILSLLVSPDSLGHSRTESERWTSYSWKLKQKLKTKRRTKMQLDHERTNKFFFFFFMTINVCFAFAFAFFFCKTHELWDDLPQRLNLIRALHECFKKRWNMVIADETMRCKRRRASSPIWGFFFSFSFSFVANFGYLETKNKYGRRGAANCPKD